MPRTRLLTCLLAALLLLIGAARADAQVRNLLPQLFKSGEKTRTAFAELVAEAGQSVVTVLSEGKVASLGVVVEADGYIITKASELNDKLQCKLKDGKTYDAKLIGVQPVYDIAMLKIDAKELKAIKWSSIGKPEVGSWLASVGTTKEPLAVGVVSTPRRAIAKQPGALGIQRKVTIVDGKEETPKEAQIGTIYPNSAASEAGLKVDDIITHVNGKAVETFEQLRAIVLDHGPGDQLTLKVKRGEDTFEVTVELSPMTVLPMAGDARGNMQNRMGGKLSTRRYGFPQVIQHDTVLNPEQCGGPVVALDGSIVGINIARAGRVESYAVPSDVITGFIADLKSGKLPPPVTVARRAPDEPKKDDKAEAKKDEKKDAAMPDKPKEEKKDDKPSSGTSPSSAPEPKKIK